MTSFTDCYQSCKATGGSAIRCLRTCMTTKPVPKPTSTKALLHAQTGCATRDIKVGDTSFDPIPLQDMQTFLEIDKTDLIEYKKDIFDCENFALRLHANAHDYFARKGLNADFGELWGPVQLGSKVVAHGINCFRTPGNFYHLIEPQDDGIHTIREYLRGVPYWIVIS